MVDKLISKDWIFPFDLIEMIYDENVQNKIIDDELVEKET